MPATASPRTVPGPETLRLRLAALRRRLKMVGVARGTGWLLSVLLLPVLAAGFLDWRMHLPPLARVLTLVGTLVAAGLVILHFLMRVFTERMDDLTLALRVEEHFPGFNDALASTVQFLDEKTDESTADSRALRGAAIKRTLGRARGLDFNRVVDRRGLRAAMLTGTTALAATIALIGLYPSSASTALVRLADPFGPREWPHQTRIEMETPRQRIGRNEAFDVRAVLRGVIPEQASAEFQLDNVPVIFTAEVAKDGPSFGRLSIHVPPDRIQRSFRFHVRANDSVSEEYVVTVLPPPQLVPLGPDEPSPHLRLTYPAYTGLPSPAILSAGTGNIEAVNGTSVSLRARADRPLRLAAVQFLPEDRTIVPCLALAPIAAANGLSAVMALAGGQTVQAPVAAALDADQRTFRVDFLPPVAGMYALHIEDESGLSASRLFELRLQQDPAPTVQLDRPSPARDLLSVLPQANLTLAISADDPVFAVRNVFLEYRIGRQGARQVRTLYDPEAVAARVGPALGPGLQATRLRLRPQHVEIQRSIAVSEFTQPDGTAPHDGDLILLTACADDFDDVTPDKQPGRSHEVEIHVVGRETLDVEINQEQTRIQQDLQRVREKEREALGRVTSVENELKKAGKLGPDQLDQVVQAEQSQQQVREQVGTEKEGLRARALRVLDTLRQNGLDNSAEKARSAEVARQLERLAAEELEQAETQLSAVRTRTEQQEEKDSADRSDQHEARARDAERRAETSEAAARDSAARADKAAQEAANTKDPQEKARLQTAAEQSRRQAEEQKKNSQEARQEAAREHILAAKPRESLAEARRHQEEVEKTLTDLLQQMEPWTNSREIKGETGRLLQEQQKLQTAVEELSARKEFQGGAASDLNDRQRAELETLADAQKKQEQRTSQLLEKMGRIAEERKEKDPEGAKALEDARDHAANGNIVGQMHDATEELRKNQLSNAKEAQKASVAGLRQLLKDLEERREAELERLAKKSREAEKELNDLFNAQERLKKKMMDAQGIADPKKREETLQSLRREQADLHKSAQDLLQRLTQERGTGRASQALSKAGQQMEQSAMRLERGEAADQAMEDVLDRLDEARAEAEQATDRTENELEREQRARVADTLKRLKERAEALHAESNRVQQKIRRAIEEKTRTGPTRVSLGDVTRNEKELANEITELAKKELTATPVFSRLVKRSAEAMTQASSRLDTLAGGDLPPPDKLPDEEAARLQAQSLRRLDRVIESLKEEPGGGRAARAEGGQGGAGQGGGGAADTSLPESAQLKVLRKMQEDVNQRTASFSREHRDAKGLDDKARTELRDIAGDQKDVAELLEQLRSGAEPPEGAEGKKP